MYLEQNAGWFHNRVSWVECKGGLTIRKGLPILSLTVRDATSRLPNGEGTRLDVSS